MTDREELRKLAVGATYSAGGWLAAVPDPELVTSAEAMTPEARAVWRRSLAKNEHLASHIKCETTCDRRRGRRMRWPMLMLMVFCLAMFAQWVWLGNYVLAAVAGIGFGIYVRLLWPALAALAQRLLDAAHQLADEGTDHE